MFCKKCGNSLPDGATFCGGCGAKIEVPAPVVEEAVPVVQEAAPTIQEAPVKSDKKKSKKALVIAIVAVVLAAVIGVAGFLVWKIFFNKVDLVEYMDVDGTSGFSGYASLDYEFKFVDLARDLELDGLKDIKELKDLQDDGDFYWGMSAAELKSLAKEYDLDIDEFIDLYKAIEIKVPNNGSLKNGDKGDIEIIVSDDADFSKKLVGGKVAFEVEDLEEAEVLDLFGETEITFTGKNGEGSMNINKDYSSSWRYSVSFEADKETFSNGDTVVVTATVKEENYKSYYNDLMEDGYYLPKTQTKEFTISGLTVYAELKDITADVQTEAVNFIKSKSFANSSYDKVTCGSIYFVSRDGAESSSYYGRENAILLVFTTEKTYTYLGKYTYTYMYRISDIKLDEEGKVIIDTNNSYGSLFTITDSTNINERIESYYTGYTVKKVK